MGGGGVAGQYCIFYKSVAAKDTKLCQDSATRSRDTNDEQQLFAALVVAAPIALNYVRPSGRNNDHAQWTIKNKEETLIRVTKVNLVQIL